MAIEPKAAAAKPVMAGIVTTINGVVQPTEKSEFRDLRAGEAVPFEINHAWHYVNAPQGATPEKLSMHPTFFNLIAANDAMDPGVHRHDIIYVVAADGRWVAEYVAADATQGRVLAILKNVCTIPLHAVIGGPKPVPDNWRIRRVRPDEYAGNDGWISEEIEARPNRSIRKIEESGLPFRSEQDAYTGLINHPMFRAEDVAHYQK